MLLRFLANGEVRAVGSSRTTRVDVRVIAATHRNLEDASRQGRFREDLYYRLRRVVLDIPPLRARHADIPLLIQHFRLRYNARHGLAVNGLTAAAMRRLEAYPWLGNVRELEAVLEEAMIFKGGGWLAPGDFALGAPAEETPERLAPPGGGPALTPYQEEALQIAARRGEVRRRDLVGRFGISRESARRQLLSLVRMGVLRRVGGGRGTRYLPSTSS